MLIAVPVSFGIALFLTEVALPRLRTPVGSAIELFAGILPDCSMQAWACSCSPVMGNAHHPFLSAHLGNPPPVGTLSAGRRWVSRADGRHVLAIMAIPFIASVMREVFLTVPTRPGVGLVRWAPAPGGGLGHRPALHPAQRSAASSRLGRVGETIWSPSCFGNVPAHRLAVDASNLHCRHHRQHEFTGSRFGDLPRPSWHWVFPSSSPSSCWPLLFRVLMWLVRRGAAARAAPTCCTCAVVRPTPWPRPVQPPPPVRVCLAGGSATLRASLRRRPCS